LNAPGGTLPALITAVDAGADSVYIGFRSATNLRNLPGLNFSLEEAAEGVKYAHARGAEVFIAVNTHPADDHLDQCFRAIDDAKDIGADAAIIADWGLLEYARNKHPDLPVHLSCLAGASDGAAIRFYHEQFGVKCVILPRVLSLEQVAAVRAETDVLLEAIVFGVLCANYDGRCCLSSFITGSSANSNGACTPVEHLEFIEDQNARTTVRLNGIAIDSFGADEQHPYPAPCKGTYYNRAIGRSLRAFQDSCSLNAMSVLPGLAAAGVNTVKIEGRQRSLAYVRLVTSIWRQAIDALERQDVSSHGICENEEIQAVLEGKTGTPGAFLHSYSGSIRQTQ